MKVGCVISRIVEAMNGVIGGSGEDSAVRVQACAMLLRAIEVRCELSTGDLDKEV